MEMGSSSPPSSNSSDSLNGLKFGQKIYFEDVGVGPSAKSGGGLSSLAAGGSGGQPPPRTPPKKGRSGVVQAGQPPRCQVEGCQVDLSDAKAYYSRHKVCGMHSKTPKVIVGGQEQRFCQQCSRFHQLSEFDQGKRSCRRRLAGHNERRRKPPPGSLLASRYGRLSSSVFENSRSGGFLMDFTTHPRVTAGGDFWPITCESNRVLGGQPTATGKFLPHPWQSESENPPSNLFLQGSVSATSYSSAAPSYHSGACVTGASDSSCALSLLSNQPWGSRDQPSSLGANSFLNADGTLVVLQSVAATTHGTSADHFFGASSWGFKGSEAGGSSHEIPPGLGQSQTHHQPATTGQYAGELELAQQGGRQYLELQNSQAYDSSSSDQHMHWSL